jgi:hypothetical protein
MLVPRLSLVAKGCCFGVLCSGGDHLQKGRANSARELPNQPTSFPPVRSKSAQESLGPPPDAPSLAKRLQAVRS